MASILLIEDDKQHLEYLEEAVEFGGHVAFPAKNTSIAMQILQNNHIDYIITDIYLPVMNGLECMEILQSKGNNIPFVVISGSVEEVHKEKAKELKAVSFLVKPIDPVVLLDSIII